MPKEFLTFELNRVSGTPWGIRIGGGVDRGKVLVLEKVRNTSKMLIQPKKSLNRDFYI
jgi:hypothetical protein